MKNPLAALTRLFSREQKAPFTTKLFASAIGQPLFVHPAMGEQIIGAYLSGAVDARPESMVLRPMADSHMEDGEGSTESKITKQIAVLNVSGGLVNRSERGECGDGPLSYEDMRSYYDEALADQSVSAIVFRLETPGGMASGMLDFADYVYANRDKKPTYACIDDYAYSAGYGIAAACKEIWITQSGGAGSVGVIGYHIDQSGYDANIGVKVTAVYSGSHKNDLTPHEPLADDQRAWLQERMDSMRAMFAGAVAKYRGMSLEAVLATEAQVYQGQAAIDIGFADRIGTFAEMIQTLSATPSPQPAPTPAAAAPTLSAEQLQQVDYAAAVSTIMQAPINQHARLALLKVADVTQASVSERITHAQACADLCAAAGDVTLSADYIARNTPLDVVRTQLLGAKAADGSEIDTTPPPKTSQASKLDSAAIYQQRRTAAEGVLK